jgi:carboxypeptidase Q
MKKSLRIFVLFIMASTAVTAQSKDPVLKNIIDEANNNSQLKSLAHEIFDVVGPRLVGTPNMKNANDLIVKMYKEWGIEAKNEQWGTWRGWERGITHIDMTYPRVQSLKGTQLAWSASTKKKGVEGEVVHLPTFNNKADFQRWLKTVKGKFVMASAYQPTGRPDYNWEEFATEESFAKIRKERSDIAAEFRKNIGRTGFNSRTFTKEIEAAGAVGIVQSRWSNGFGVQKIFSSSLKKIPTVDLELEDYGMLYRMSKSGKSPKIKVNAQSKELGRVPVFNTIGMIKGTEKPNEYIMLSAHLDSWDGGTGATDNGTGTLVMLETMRVLKKMYPNPKRTIIVGHWGSEEQGLNGSRAYVKDNPEIVKNIQAAFNQDNGTGRVVSINGAGFLHSYDYLNSWLAPVPRDVRKHIKTSFPGSPSGGGSDNASFLAAGVPTFNLSALNWSYWNYTWHTNRDTYDKVVFDDVRNNVVLTAVLAYMASEDPDRASKQKIEMPINPRTGKPRAWPTARSPQRKGGM